VFFISFSAEILGLPYFECGNKELSFIGIDFKTIPHGTLSDAIKGDLLRGKLPATSVETLQWAQQRLMETPGAAAAFVSFFKT
jgi:hypothetical protein